MAIGRILFSHTSELCLFLLILLFTGLVITQVAIEDYLESAKTYILAVELCILLAFQLELMLKAFVLGLVVPT